MIVRALESSRGPQIDIAIRQYLEQVVNESPCGMPVYLFPCRIQQGWGDLIEISKASHALQRSGCQLLYLSETPASTGRTGRPDLRTLPVDPSGSRNLGFPSVRKVNDPLGHGRAIVLATWWGMTCRTVDLENARSRGVYSERMDMILKVHGRENVLTMSLEEFASLEDSATSTREALRQAGWDRKRIAAFSKTREWHERCRRFHDAYFAARGADEPTVLHLTASFSHSARATEEFPFMVETGTFGFPKKRPSSAMGRQVEGRRRHRVLWYASPESSSVFASMLFEALKDTGQLVELEIRTPGAAPSAFPIPRGDSPLAVKFLPELKNDEWRKKVAGADLVITSGSQSLCDVLSLVHPFLYFNGFFPEDKGTPSRAFRREKLLNLLKAWMRSGVPEGVLRDLSDFADGRNVRSVIMRALTSENWRDWVTAPLRKGRWPPWNHRSGQLDGDTYISSLATRWASYTGTATRFVAMQRERANPQSYL